MLEKTWQTASSSGLLGLFPQRQQDAGDLTFNLQSLEHALLHSAYQVKKTHQYTKGLEMET